MDRFREPEMKKVGKEGRMGRKEQKVLAMHTRISEDVLKQAGQFLELVEENNILISVFLQFFVKLVVLKSCTSSWRQIRIIGIISVYRPLIAMSTGIYDVSKGLA